MTRILTVLAWIGADLGVITASYMLAVLLRIGGRFELAVDIGGAAGLAAAAALVQVLGYALLGVYGRSWPTRLRQLTVLLPPAMFAGAFVAFADLLSAENLIPLGSILPGTAFGAAGTTALHLRSRWASILHAAMGRRVELAPSLPVIAEAPRLRDLLIAPSDTIRSAIAAIDRSVARIALVIEAGTLRGVITDGDVRRAILGGIALDDPASHAMTNSPIVADANATDEEILGLMKRHVVRQIPIVDDGGQVIDLRVLDLMSSEVPALCEVLIMAGGLGTRLRDITRDVPKPLVRIHGRPVLDMLIEDLVAQGFRRLILAVNYRADLIREHVGDGSRFGAHVDYVQETEPLGTAGAIRLARPMISGREFIVTNADLLTRVNFRELLSFHRRHNHELTLAVIESTLQLRYGLVETRGTRVVGIREKPALKHFINAGIYVLGQEVAELVPERRFEMDQVVDVALKRDLLVGCFPVHEYWTDIGEPQDLRRASAELPTRLAGKRKPASEQ